ncbi:MAG: D-arabinono-1,4-lactone oxidase [Flavobacteriaceae bacterium]
MKRSEFLKQSLSIGIGATIFPQIISCKGIKKENALKNWAGNLQYNAVETRYPRSTQELQTVIVQLDKAKALGTMHCFNKIADTTGIQLSTKNLTSVYEIDEINQTVTVDSGIKYGDLGVYLNQRGWALHNLASLPHISVGGSCATATHGSGINNGNLTSAIVGFEILYANGDLNWIDPTIDNEFFNATAVNLGALGIITKVKLRIEPTYSIKQFVFENLSIDQLETHFDSIMGAGYSVSFFTHWLNNNIDQVWVKCKIDQEFDGMNLFYGSSPAIKDLHPIKVNSPVNCTPQLGLEGPWHERLPHFRMDFTPSNGDELQSEYFIDRVDAFKAIKAIIPYAEEMQDFLYISEIRCIAKDNFWMSTAFDRESVALHFTWKPKPKEVYAFLPKLEFILSQFSARPHWGKIFTTQKERIFELYPKALEFVSLKKELDSNGIFSNQFTHSVLGV